MEATKGAGLAIASVGGSALRVQVEQKRGRRGAFGVARVTLPKPRLLGLCVSSCVVSRAPALAAGDPLWPLHSLQIQKGLF